MAHRARLTPALLALLALLSCRAEGPAGSAAGPATPAPAAQAGAPRAAAPLAPLPPGRGCAYRLRQVGTEAGASRLFAGHELHLEYTLGAPPAPAGGGTVSLVARVTRVHGKGRRDVYEAALDSDRRGDRVRVEGGADTQVLLELVAPFALLDTPVTFTLDGGGRAARVEGGAQARARLLAMFPPGPRAAPLTARLVEEVLGDEALARLLVPHGALGAGEGPLVHRAIREAPVEATILGLAATGRAALRPTLRGGDVFLEYEARLAPPAPPPATPTVRALVDAERSVTVRVTPPDPCPAEAAASEKARLLEPVEAGVEPVERTVTWLWTRAEG
jgi:hypothetical protein